MLSSQTAMEDYSYMLLFPVTPLRFEMMFPGRRYLFDMGSGKYDAWAGARVRVDEATQSMSQKAAQISAAGPCAQKGGPLSMTGVFIQK
jgi:hypothetical protein